MHIYVSVCVRENNNILRCLALAHVTYNTNCESKRLNFEVWFPQNLITQTCASKNCASKLAFPYEVLGVLGRGRQRERERQRE